jgi:hypothetical protein
MSRTIRRKDGHGWCYGHSHVLRDYQKVYQTDGEHEWSVWMYVHIDPKSKEGKKLVAQFHSDAKTWGNSHGPGWFIAEFIQQPYRQDARRQIQKWMRDEDFEVIIADKPKRIYWD